MPRATSASAPRYSSRSRPTALSIISLAFGISAEFCLDLAHIRLYPVELARDLMHVQRSSYPGQISCDSGFVERHMDGSAAPADEPKSPLRIIEFNNQRYLMVFREEIVELGQILADGSPKVSMDLA